MSQLHVYNCLCLPDILGQLTFLLVLEIRFPAMFWKFSEFKVLAYFTFMPLFHRFKILSCHIRTDNLYDRSVLGCLCLPDILGQLTFLLVLEIRFPAMFWKFSEFKVLAYFTFMPLFHRFKTLSWHIRTDNLYDRSVLGCFGRNLKLRKCLHFEESLYDLLKWNARH